MRIFFSTLVIIFYPFLAFYTFHAIKFFRKNSYISIDMFPKPDAADLKFIYLVFTISAIIQSVYILLHHKIYVMEFLARFSVYLLLILLVFAAFIVTHKIFYYFDSITTAEWIVKMLTTSVPTTFVILTIHLCEKRLF